MTSPNNKLKSDFATAANALTVFYKNAQSAQQDSYAAGQKDALNELVQYIVQESGGDPRKLLTSKFIEHLEAKIRDTEAQIPQANLPIHTPATNPENFNQGGLGGMSPMPNHWEPQSTNEGGFHLNNQILIGGSQSVPSQNQPIYYNQPNFNNPQKTNPNFFFQYNK